MSDVEMHTFTFDANVIADMAGHAAMESYGVVGMASPTLSDGIARLLSANKLRNGIKVDLDSDTKTVNVKLYIIVEYGTNIVEISRMLREKVIFVLTDYLQLKVGDVDVFVQGIKVRKKD